MLGALFDGPALRAARTALTGLTRREETIAGNIANIDTPGYQRREVSFERALKASIGGETGRASMATTDPRHFTTAGRGPGNVPNYVTPRDVVSARNDGNTVSIDEEMTLLAETQIRFQALSQTVGRRLSTLRTVIRG